MLNAEIAHSLSLGEITVRTFMKNTMSFASKTISIAACVLSLWLNQPSSAQFMEFENVKVSSDGTAMMLSTATKFYRWSASTGLVLIKTFPANTYSDIDYGNANGTTAIGWNGSDTVSKLWRWTSTGGFKDSIGLSAYKNSYLGGLNDSASTGGTVIAGYSFTGAGWDMGGSYKSDWEVWHSRAFRWAAGTTGSAGTTTDLGVLPGDVDSDLYGGAMSSDGTVIVGRSRDFSKDTWHIFRWKKNAANNAGVMSKILDFPRAYGNVSYINSNGTTVVGSITVPVDESNSTSKIWRWTSAGTNKAIGLTQYKSNDIGEASADGTVIAGTNYNGSPWGGQLEYTAQAFRWVAGTGTTGIATPLGFLPGDTDSDIYGWDNKAISSDGTVIVGRSWGGDSQRHVFRWVKNASNNSGVMTKIIDMPVDGVCDIAYINANGTTIVGITSSYSYDGGDSTSTSKVWRWTKAGGLNSTIGLPTYSKHNLSSVSSDGTVIAGNSFSGDSWSPTKSKAFRWVATTATGNAGTTTALGGLAGDTDTNLDRYGSSMSLDGSVIVGQSWNSKNPQKMHAFRWKKTTGNAGVMTGIGLVAPVIASVSPNYGAVAGGTSVTITGTNLNGATVKVNGVAATSVVVVSATSITAKTPAGTVGAKAVAVTTAGGTVTKANAFTYTSSFTGDETDSSGSGTGGDGRATTTKANGTDASAAQATNNPAAETIVAAPMGVELYLQTISQQADARVVCDDTSATTSVDAMGSTGNAVTIDLDHNGEADICQLRGGDLDLNGVIDERDMTNLLNMINVEPVLGIGDLDGNGVIDSADISVLLLRMN